MRFRVMMASLLTVILLSFSSISSTCEIRCGLKSVGASCHDAPHAARLGEMPAMAGMNHSVVKPHITAAPGLLLQPAHCTHHVCAQQPAVLDEQAAVLFHVTMNAGIVAPHTQRLSSAPARGVGAVRGHPRFHPATPVSFHTTLLI